MTKSAEEIAFLEKLSPEDRELAERLGEHVDALKAGAAKGQLECMACGKQLRIDRGADGQGWTAECLCGWQVAGLNGLPKH